MATKPPKKPTRMTTGGAPKPSDAFEELRKVPLVERKTEVARGARRFRPGRPEGVGPRAAGGTMSADAERRMITMLAEGKGGEGFDDVLSRSEIKGARKARTLAKHGQDIPRAAGRRARVTLSDETITQLQGIGDVADRQAMKVGAKRALKTVGKAALKGAAGAAGIAAEVAWPNELMAGEPAELQAQRAEEGKMMPAYFLELDPRAQAAVSPWAERPEYAAAWGRINEMMMQDPMFHPSNVATQAMWAEAGDPAAAAWLQESIGVVPTSEEAYGLMEYHGIAAREMEQGSVLPEGLEE